MPFFLSEIPTAKRTIFHKYPRHIIEITTDYPREGRLRKKNKQIKLNKADSTTSWLSSSSS